MNIVPIASLLSTIPAALAWRYGGVERGTTMDSDFYQAIAGMMLQFLSLITFWPSLSDPQLSIKSRFLMDPCGLQWTLLAGQRSALFGAIDDVELYSCICWGGCSSYSSAAGY
jgi:hypothetical protein